MIKAYTGLTGSGKTLSMIIDAAKFHKRFPNREIYANFHCQFPDGIDILSRYSFIGREIKDLYYEYNIKWKLATILRSDDFIDKLMSTRDGLFLVDEAGFVFNNRKWRKLPFDLVARFQQSRKIGVDIFYTTQAINRVDLTLRELTHMQVMCDIQTLPFTDINFMLSNEAYFSPIIGHDSQENRKLYYAYREIMPFFMFKKFYPYYDTLEIVEYSVVK